MTLREPIPLIAPQQPELEALPVPDPRILALQSAAETPQAKEEAFSSIVEEFGGRLEGYVSRIAGSHRAEDIVQDTFFAAWRTVGGFEQTSPKAVANWLFRIAHNRALNETRRDKYYQIPRDTAVSGPTDSTDGPESNVLSSTPSRLGNPAESYEFGEDMASLGQVIETQREALVLSLCGFSYDEIAEHQGTSYSAAKARIVRGRKTAQRVLKAS